MTNQLSRLTSQASESRLELVQAPSLLGRRLSQCEPSLLLPHKKDHSSNVNAIPSLKLHFVPEKSLFTAQNSSLRFGTRWDRRHFTICAIQCYPLDSKKKYYFPLRRCTQQDRCSLCDVVLLSVISFMFQGQKIGKSDAFMGLGIGKLIIKYFGT